MALIERVRVNIQSVWWPLTSKWEESLTDQRFEKKEKKKNSCWSVKRKGEQKRDSCMYLKGSKVGNRCLKKKSVCLEEIYIISVEDNTTYLLQEQFVDRWIKNDHMREVWRDPSRSSTPNADRRICEDSRKQQLVHETAVSWYMIKKI